MANTLPWKQLPAGLPDDTQLDAVAEARRAQRIEQVRDLVADPEVYQHRLDERGTRTHERLIKTKYGWRWMTVLNASHAGTAAVNEGSAKAIRTTLPEDDERRLRGLPDRPSIAWLRKIDRNTAIDQERVAIRVERSQRPVGDTVTELPETEEIQASRQIGHTKPKQRLSQIDEPDA